MEILSYLPIIYAYFIPFIMVMTRIGVLLTTVTVLHRDKITMRMLVTISVVLSLYVILQQPKPVAEVNFSLPIIIAMLVQGLIGFTGALIINIVFDIFIGMGQIVAIQIGLSMASLIDQRYGYITSMADFYFIVASVLFFLLNGHLVLFKTVVDSFSVLPISAMQFNANLLPKVASYAGVIFTGATLLAIISITVALLINIALATMTKFAPQFNIFSIGVNIQLAIGLFMLYLTFSLFTQGATSAINDGLLTFRQFMLGLKYGG